MMEEDRESASTRSTNTSYPINIGVGTGGATESMAPYFSAKIILRIFPFFLKHIFYTEKDSP